MDRERKYQTCRLDEVEISASPKKSNLHDLNNLIGMNLLDVVSKVFIFILNSSSQKLLKKRAHTMQHDATPKVNCAEVVF